MFDKYNYKHKTVNFDEVLAERNVYLMRMSVSGEDYFKIGFSNNPHQRAKTINASLPFDIEVLFTYKTPKASELESMLHYKYSEYRIRGEWFSLKSDHQLEIVTGIFDRLHANIPSCIIDEELFSIDKDWFFNALDEITNGFHLDVIDFVGKRQYNIIKSLQEIDNGKK